LLSLSLSRAANGYRAPASTVVRHVLAYDRDGVPWAYGFRRAGELWLEVPDLVTFHLPAGSAILTARTASADDSVDSDAVLDAYYGTALPFVAQATLGLEVLHGSAVVVPSQGCVAAFCGISESGKSTVAHGLAARGYRRWSDDALAFRVDGAQPVTAVGLPFTVKLRERSAAHFGTTSGGVDFVEDSAWKSTRLGAVFILEPTDPECSGEAVAIDRLVPGDALHALLPNAYRFQPQTDERRRETMRSYLELVASVPIFAARFRRGFDRLPELLDELEHRMSAVRPLA
jgi:hypothetical protein